MDGHIFLGQRLNHTSALSHSHSSHSSAYLLNLDMDDTRVLDGEMLQTSIIYLERKRKLQAEELGLPPTKHKWLSGNCNSKYDYSADADFDAISARWDSGEDSAKDSNSVAADADSAISVSNDADVSMDQACSSYYVGSSSKDAADWSDSTSVMKSGSTNEEEDECANQQSSMNYEDHREQYGCPIDCSCSECVLNFDDYTDKEVEQILLNNGILPDSYELSNGRWTLKQDVEPVSSKLTIDKEFEQYFSTLML